MVTLRIVCGEPNSKEVRADDADTEPWVNGPAETEGEQCYAEQFNQI